MGYLYTVDKKINVLNIQQLDHKANKDAPAYVKAIVDAAKDLKIDENDDEPIIVIETEKEYFFLI